MRLLFLCGFPGPVAQVTASCIAQCGQKCKELRSVKGGEKLWENREGQGDKEELTKKHNSL